MVPITLPLLSMVALGAAQTSTVSLFLPFADPQSLVGSIAGGDASATTFVVQCANATATTTGEAAAGAAETSSAGDSVESDSADSEGCGFPSPIKIVQGPSTVQYALTRAEVVQSLNCVLSSGSIAVCTGSVSVSGPTTGETGISSVMTSASEPDKSDFAETVTLSGSDYSLLPVVITAGSVSNTGSASVAAATTSASSTGSSDSTPGSTPSAATVTGTSTGTTAESSGGAGHMRPALGIGAAGALAAVAAVVL